MATQSLSTALLSLPDPIADWLSSEQITDIVADFNKEIKTKNENVRVLPRLILQVAVQAMNPRDFTNELINQLGIKHEDAKQLTREIYDKVFKPIEVHLKKIGVDASLMTEYATPPSIIKTPAKTIPAPKSEINPPDNLPLAPQPPKPVEGKPFVLYEEREEIKPTESGSRPSFTFRTPLKEREEKMPPPRVEVERVVHYSSFYTPLNQANIPVPKSKWFI